MRIFPSDMELRDLLAEIDRDPHDDFGPEVSSDEIQVMRMAAEALRINGLRGAIDVLEAAKFGDPEYVAQVLREYLTNE